MTVAHGAAPIRFGVFEADPASGELRRSGAKVRLHEQPFQVLLALLERPGEVVLRHELQHRLWPDDTFVEFDNSLNHAISRLREALGDSTENPRFIETLPRRGYRFIAPISTPLENLRPPAAVPEAAVRPGRVNRRLIVVAVVAVVAMVAAVAGRFYWRQRSAPSASSIQSLAVLPFKNLSGDADQEYFVDGMTEALILELSRIRPLRVISRTSAMHYKTTTKRAPQIAGELGVDAVVEGSVQREGNRVRVTVQLIHGPSDAHVWANSYEREMESILALHREVAQAISGEIRSTVLATRPNEDRATRRIDPDVYQLYLRGRHLLNRQTEPELRQALAYLQQVVERDPTYAPAHAAIATAWEAMAAAGSYVPPREGFPKARAAAERALALDPGLAEAHVRLAGVTELYDWRLDAAETYYKRILEFAPNDTETLQRYSLFLSRTGQGEEALGLAERAHAVDSRSADVTISLAARLMGVGRRDEALRWMEQARDLDPTYYEPWVHLSHVYEALQRPVDQVAAARKGVELSGAVPHALHALARAYATTGHEAEAALIVKELDRRPAQRNPYELARMHLLLKRNESALFWLEQACAERTPAMAFFQLAHTSRGFDPIRKHPRFLQVLRCAGVVAADAHPLR
jgi:TolB-like protein/DNA-binding winged helix-turn-helix (wHTH) protein/Tfp pilus assembly protein PilF